MYASASAQALPLTARQRKQVGTACPCAPPRRSGCPQDWLQAPGASRGATGHLQRRHRAAAVAPAWTVLGAPWRRHAFSLVFCCTRCAISPSASPRLASQKSHSPITSRCPLSPCAAHASLKQALHGGKAISEAQARRGREANGLSRSQQREKHFIQLSLAQLLPCCCCCLRSTHPCPAAPPRPGRGAGTSRRWTAPSS